VEPADPNQEVVQFIVEHLDTVPHLEALLLIWQNPTTHWTAPILASRVYVSTQVAQQVLDDFKLKGIVRTAAAAEDTYVYRPEWDDGGRIPKVAELYRRQLVQVTKLIHSKGSSSVREFARAFQIKKDH